MYNITIRDLDKEDSVIANIQADRYLLAAQQSNKFTKSFSSSDFIDHLGLIEFCKQDILKDMQRANSPSIISGQSIQMPPGSLPEIGGGKIAKI
jgi:hypothetical protein